MSVLKTYKVCFIGTTGYGKTTLINSIFGTKFNTDPLVSCTKELYTVTLMDKYPEDYDAITVYDTPGIGEFSSNEKYQKFYEEAASEADCIVLVVKLDRTDAPAQRLLLSLKPFIKDDTKLFIALNHIDATTIAGRKEYVSWDTTSNSPTPECIDNINTRIIDIETKFSRIHNIDGIVPVCGFRMYGIETLLNNIIC